MYTCGPPPKRPCSLLRRSARPRAGPMRRWGDGSAQHPRHARRTGATRSLRERAARAPLRGPSSTGLHAIARVSSAACFTPHRGPHYAFTHRRCAPPSTHLAPSLLSPSSAAAARTPRALRVPAGAADPKATEAAAEPAPREAVAAPTLGPPGKAETAAPSQPEAPRAAAARSCATPSRLAATWAKGASAARLPALAPHNSPRASTLMIARLTAPVSPAAPKIPPASAIATPPIPKASPFTKRFSPVSFAKNARCRVPHRPPAQPHKLFKRSLSSGQQRPPPPVRTCDTQPFLRPKESSPNTQTGLGETRSPENGAGARFLPVTRPLRLPFVVTNATGPDLGPR